MTSGGGGGQAGDELFMKISGSSAAGSGYSHGSLPPAAAAASVADFSSAEFLAALPGVAGVDGDVPFCFPTDSSFVERAAARLARFGAGVNRPASEAASSSDNFNAEESSFDRRSEAGKRKLQLPSCDQRKREEIKSSEKTKSCKSNGKQATNSHSIAERLRREKINERMKLLQDLVPGCSKVTGKAVMLDEIINYVQSLQRQVEFLSMKLSVVGPQLDTVQPRDFCLPPTMLPSACISFSSDTRMIPQLMNASPLNYIPFAAAWNNTEMHATNRFISVPQLDQSAGHWDNGFHTINNNIGHHAVNGENSSGEHCQQFSS